MIYLLRRRIDKSCLFSVDVAIH